MVAYRTFNAMICGAVSALSLSTLAHAETLTYTGQALTSGNLAGTHVQATVTIPVPIYYTGSLIFSDNYPIEPNLSTFTLSDSNGLTIAGADFPDYEISMNLVNGLPVSWYISATGASVPLGISTTNTNGIVADKIVGYVPGSYIGGEIDNAPGVWTLASAAPEPAIWSLMLLGVGGLGAVMRGRRREAINQTAG